MEIKEIIEEINLEFEWEFIEDESTFGYFITDGAHHCICSSKLPEGLEKQIVKGYIGEYSLKKLNDFKTSSINSDKKRYEKENTSRLFHVRVSNTTYNIVEWLNFMKRANIDKITILKTKMNLPMVSYFYYKGFKVYFCNSQIENNDEERSDKDWLSLHPILKLHKIGGLF